jgi:hypothetical protein
MTKAFISYTWDSDEHQTWVEALATRLRNEGVDITMDKFELAPGDYLAEFMERVVRESEHIVIVCTGNYKIKANRRDGGAGYETDLMTAEALVLKNRRKFIAVLREESQVESMPSWLLGTLYIDLRKDPYSEHEYKRLYKTLCGVGPVKPILGEQKPRGSEASKLADATRGPAACWTPSERRDQLPYEDDLYLAKNLDCFYKVLRLLTPDQNFRLPQGADSLLQEVRHKAAVITSRIAAMRLDERLGRGYSSLTSLLDEHRAMMARRRDLDEEERVALARGFDRWAENDRAKAKNNPDDERPLAVKVIESMQEKGRIDKLIRLDYAAKDRALQQEFERLRSDTEAKTDSWLREVALARGWDEGEVVFEPESDLWLSYCRAVWEDRSQDGIVFLESLCRRGQDRAALSAWFHQTTHLPHREAPHLLSQAAVMCLSMPCSEFYDDDRLELFNMIATLSLETLRSKQNGKSFGAGDCAYAEKVVQAWTALREARPAYDPITRVEAEIFSLAAAGRLEDARKLGAAQDRKLMVSSRLPYTMARIYSRLGQADSAMEWLKYGLRSKAPMDIAQCKKEMDLETVRAQKAMEFGELFAVRCSAILDQGFFRNDLVLTNLSQFPLTQLVVTVPITGGTPITLPIKDHLETGGSCTWKGVQAQVGQSRGRYEVNIQLTCSEGTYKT